MKILKDCRQYFEVPPVETLPIGSWRGSGRPVNRRKEASKSKPSTKNKSPSPARARGAVTAVLDLDRPADPAREINAALDAALNARAFQVTREEISKVLDAVFPPSLCIEFRHVTPQDVESTEDVVFLISYEQELNCLMKDGSIDRQWKPAGMRPTSDRHENR